MSETFFITIINDDEEVVATVGPFTSNTEANIAHKKLKGHPYVESANLRVGYPTDAEPLEDVLDEFNERLAEEKLEV